MIDIALAIDHVSERAEAMIDRFLSQRRSQTDRDRLRKEWRSRFTAALGSADDMEQYAGELLAEGMTEDEAMEMIAGQVARSRNGT